MPLTGPRFDSFRSQLFSVKSSHDNGDAIHLNDLIALINGGSMQFTRGEIVATIKDMSDSNSGVWYQDELEALMFI